MLYTGVIDSLFFYNSFLILINELNSLFALFTCFVHDHFLKIYEQIYQFNYGFIKLSLSLNELHVHYIQGAKCPELHEKPAW